MKRFAILTILLVVFVGIPLSTLGKSGNDESGSAAQFCKANDNLGYSSLGQCINIFKTSYSPGNSGPVGVCKEFLNKDPEQFYDSYNNLDECVNFLRTGYVHE